MGDLDARLLRAHAARDLPALIALYQEASARATDEDAKGFYLTHAYVFALEAGHPDAGMIKSGLIAMGREPRDSS